MTNLHERYVVPCPYVRAREYLAQMLEPAAVGNRTQRVTLHAPVAHVPAEFQKDVLVRYAAGTDPMHFDQPWRISWAPAGGGAYPTFAGELTVRADEDYGTAILELDGAYTPPLGAAGRAFDSAVGHRIASATAQSLLQSIAEEMKLRFDTEEAAKKQAPR